MNQEATNETIKMQLALVDKYELTGKISSGFKDLSELREEITQGECFIEEIMGEDGIPHLKRIVDVIGIDVFFSGSEPTQILREVLQVAHNTNEYRTRDYLLTSVSEKRHPNETYEEAVFRALDEEIHLRPPFHLKAAVIDIQRESNSYKGLQSIYRVHRFHVIIDDKQYIPNGIHLEDAYNPNFPYAYMEHQPGRKNVYFAWYKFQSE